MNDELKSLIPDAEEVKRLIEDAAKLLNLRHPSKYIEGNFGKQAGIHYSEGVFNPADPERGDLRKVADAAELEINYADCSVWEYATKLPPNRFTKGDYQSLALAILRAASAVYKSRGGV